MPSLRPSSALAYPAHSFSLKQPTLDDSERSIVPQTSPWLGERIPPFFSVGVRFAGPVTSTASKQILTAMGADSPSRRAWLNRMRRRFMSLDAFRVGVLGASDLLQVCARSTGKLT